MGKSEAERGGRDERGDGDPASADLRRAEGSDVVRGDAERADEEGRLANEEAVADQMMAELEELRDRHLRLAAEFENYRKRTRGELRKTRELGRADLAGRLLEALDDLRRIADVPEETATVEALGEGVALVERKLLKELREAGLEPIEAEGRRFDPNEHEALSSVPTDDPDEDQLVADVFVPGYRFGDRLLRPARVVVKTFRPEAASDQEDGGRSGDSSEGADDRT